MSVLFVGSNPSQASASSQPFEPGTRSRKVIDSWCDAIQLDTNLIAFANVSSLKTNGNRPLSKMEIENELLHLAAFIFVNRIDRVIALGVTASTAISQVGIPHLAFPHPSGRNRKWNDPEYKDKQIEILREYVHGQR